MRRIIIHLASQKMPGNINQEHSVRILWDFGTCAVYPLGVAFCLLPFIDLQPKSLKTKRRVLSPGTKKEVATGSKRQLQSRTQREKGKTFFKVLSGGFYLKEQDKWHMLFQPTPFLLYLEYLHLWCKSSGAKILLSCNAIAWFWKRGCTNHIS